MQLDTSAAVRSIEAAAAAADERNSAHGKDAAVSLVYCVSSFDVTLTLLGVSLKKTVGVKN